MRTNIDIDDDLLAEAMAVSETSTKKATVEKALLMMVKTARQKHALKELWGIGWDDDLERLRNAIP